MRRRSLIGPVLKSLVFVLVTALATTALAFGIADTGVGDTVGYRARFTDVTGLTAGDGVRIAGVRVGEVESVGVTDRRYALVRFKVRKGTPLPGTVTASVKYLDLVGRRYLELGRGTGPLDERLAPGATIPVERTHPALDLTQLFSGFQPLFQGLAPDEVNKLAEEIVQVLQGQGGTVEGLLRSVGSLTGTLAAKDEVISRVIENLNTVVATVNTHDQGFTELVATLQQLVAGFNRDRQPIGEAVQAVGALTASTAGLLAEGRAPLKDTVGQLGRLSAGLADHSTQLEDFLKRSPEKLTTLGRLASYGSWFNLYLCQATVTGVSTGDGSAPPTGVTVDEARCRG